MFVQPDDLPDQLVADVASIGWAIEPDTITYSPVGFGSHHWEGAAGHQRWFLTADEVDDGGDQLLDALGAAAALRDQGRDWVIAPLASINGALIEPINDRYVLAVYPWIDGRKGSFGAYTSRRDRAAVIDRLVELHGADSGLGPARSDDLAVPARRDLDAALGDLASSWDTGPFADPARSLLDKHRSTIASAFGRYDELTALVGAESRRYCITHGEPHPGNVIFTTDGAFLIDWDTALLAPPERDLWRLIDEDEDSRALYERLSDRALDDRALQLYRLWWDLAEVSFFTADFRRPHAETTDTTIAWESLQNSIDQLAHRLA